MMKQIIHNGATMLFLAILMVLSGSLKGQTIGISEGFHVHKRHYTDKETFISKASEFMYEFSEENGSMLFDKALWSTYYVKIAQQVSELNNYIAENELIISTQESEKLNTLYFLIDEGITVAIDYAYTEPTDAGYRITVIEVISDNPSIESFIFPQESLPN